MTTFQLTEDRELYRRFSDGSGAVSYTEPRIDATWRFDDGVTVTMQTRCDKYIYSYRTRSSGYSERVKGQHGRVYVSFPTFNLAEDLTNRFRRPHVEWKPMVVEALRRIGVEPEKIFWSQKAGCSCGCSPAFIVHGLPAKVEIFITLPAAPTVDESKPARELVSSL